MEEYSKGGNLKSKMHAVNMESRNGITCVTERNGTEGRERVRERGGGQYHNMMNNF